MVVVGTSPTPGPGDFDSLDPFEGDATLPLRLENVLALHKGSSWVAQLGHIFGALHHVDHSGLVCRDNPTSCRDTATSIEKAQAAKRCGVVCKLSASCQLVNYSKNEMGPFMYSISFRFFFPSRNGRARAHRATARCATGSAAAICPSVEEAARRSPECRPFEKKKSGEREKEEYLRICTYVLKSILSFNVDRTRGENR